VFSATPDPSNRYRLVSSSQEAQPTVTLPPGIYLVHAAFGRAGASRRITVKAGTTSTEEVVLNAGAVRIAVTNGGQPMASEQGLTIDLYADEADQAGSRRKVAGGVKPGVLLRLNSGIYHVISTLGDGNVVAEADLTVEPGKLTEATIDHRAGRITFRLATRPGGEALADTSWTILTEGGDVVKRSAGAFPTHVLAAGTYALRAEHGGKTYNQTFSVAPGDVKQVEVIAQ
jgi:hypothetical protein